MAPKEEKPAKPFTQSSYEGSLAAAEQELAGLTVKLNAVDTELKAVIERKKQLEAERSPLRQRTAHLKATIKALTSLCVNDLDTQWAERAHLVNQGAEGIQECCYEALVEA